MATGVITRRNQYYDSVFLMGVSKRISGFPGVQQNAVLMGTDANKEVLSSLGIRDPQLDAAQPSDLIVAVIADTQAIVADVLANLDDYLAGGVAPSATANPHTFEDGLEQKPNANLAVVSVPGEFAAREARKALDAGLNVFLFSDHVSIEDELAIKQLAAQKKLLVMGPGCGTSIINGVGIGFANVVRKGNIGVVAAAGTGLQEFTSQIHNAGLGISNAIGTGGDDPSDYIGGLTTFAALAALERDPQTELIAIVSKPPGAKTLAKLIERIRNCKKPVIGCFLGAHVDPQAQFENFRRASTIDEAVNLALKLSGSKPALTAKGPTSADLQRVTQERSSWAPEQKYLRGLFAGGTFCYQSQQILLASGIPVYSNAPLDKNYQLSDPNRSREHTLVDMGADEYTVGRPHPMIYGAMRKQRILAESDDPQVAILLLDFILGYNASTDPVGELLDALLQSKRNASLRGGNLTVVASVCGTDGDPQGFAVQMKLLRQAGVHVFQTNAQAASFCAALLK
ncbi:MAG: acyl-CoA synthetase FdrA [Anaerolineales bacterium]